MDTVLYSLIGRNPSKGAKVFIRLYIISGIMGWLGIRMSKVLNAAGRDLLKDIMRIVGWQEFTCQYGERLYTAITDYLEERIRNGAWETRNILTNDRNKISNMASDFTVTTWNRGRLFIISRRSRGESYFYKISGLMTKQEMYSRLCVTALPPIKNFAEHSFESRQEYVTKPNIYLPKIIMDSIYGHIDSFLRSGRTHTGIILYGPPGTGKTSLSNLIALKYNMDIFYAENRPTAHRNIRQTKVVANRSFQNGAYIMALEDFDLGLISGFGFDALGTLLSELEEKCERPVIYVLTTNNFNKIPAALLCPGRVDLRVNVPLMEDEECFCMLEDAFPGVTKDTKDRVKEAVKPHLPMAPCNIKMLLEFSVDQSKSVEENAHCFMKFFALRVDDEKKIYESRVTTQ